MRLVLLFASTLLALVSAEGGLRLVHPLWAIPYPPRSYRPGLFERWDCCGYRLHPSRVFRDRYPFPGGTVYTITANADGFRSRRELDEPDPRPRVLVLGDSMIFGPGVEEPDRVTERLEAAEPGWRVDNLGMIGFGPDLMLRALEAEGLATHPKVVVLAMFSHAVYRVIPEMVGAGFPLPRYELRDGALVTVPYPERPWWMRLYFVQGFRYGVFRYTAATFPLNEAILTRFGALAKEHDFVPAIVFVPGPRQRFDDRRRARWLTGWAAAAGIPFLDLTGPLAAAGGERLYLPRDAHWNRDGHATASAALRPFITEQLAIRHASSHGDDPSARAGATWGGKGPTSGNGRSVNLPPLPSIVAPIVSTRRSIDRPTVVLPQPDSPTSATTSPASTERLTPSTTAAGPCSPGKTVVSASTRSSGSPTAVPDTCPWLGRQRAQIWAGVSVWRV